MIVHTTRSSSVKLSLIHYRPTTPTDCFVVKPNLFLKIAKWFVFFAIFSLLILITTGLYLYIHYAPDLPDTAILRDVKYQTPLKIYSRDNQLIAEFGEKKRTPITIEEAPEQLINAFLAAEDKRFFEHSGVDYPGLIRASLKLLLTGKKKQGGSTITMQVTRNFLLSREKTYTRKLKEIFLALKIEQELSKSEILELYLNKIFLGHHAYGVAAAAQVYYGKPLTELNIAQYAMIAGLPKAPSKLNPLTNPKKALRRRNYVLKRMFKSGTLSESEFERYKSTPLSARKQALKSEVSAPYVAEMVRNEIINQYGDDAYNAGLKVYTTLNPRLQKAANNALYLALHEYDERHGYRGRDSKDQQDKVIGDTTPVTVDAIGDNQITATLPDQTTITIPWENLKWARAFKGRNRLGPSPKTPADIVKPGDFIRVRKLDNNTWKLSQIPEPEGALIALNPKNGAIVALTGGFDFSNSKFNRATQAKRQPGSGFKPILYTRALESGFTAASLINDAPVVFDERSQESEWRPENYSGKFFGPTRLRTALRKSRNLVSIRLMRSLGVKEVINAAKRFGLPDKQLPKSLSLALGSGHATPLEMARIYAVFANGGFKIEPYIIDRIESFVGETLFQAKPALACPNCNENQLADGGDYYAHRIISPQVNFIMNTLLRDVVNRGTATKALKLGRTDLAGKTGTTNEQRDAWFNGYTPTLTAIAWVGFDSAIPLGHKETGGKAALPMWMHFMKIALENEPEQRLQTPTGIVRKLINPKTGLLTAPGNKSGIWEYFREELAPEQIWQPSYEQAIPTEETAVESLF